MKTVLLFLLWISSYYFSTAQITTPVIRANFGVDADLRANYFNGAVNSAVDDWYNNGTLGTGQFIIDTIGAAAVVSGYTTNPASRMLPFSRLMMPLPYTTVSNRLMIDAIFNRDHHGTDSTVFASGSNKNGMNPATWTCPVAQNIPDKNDILDAFTHLRRAGPNVTDSLWMFGGISIVNTTGNRYFDFELYQTDIYFDRSTLTFKNYGPDEGHTSWIFDASGNVLQSGDIIFSVEFGSSVITLVEARIWVNQSALLVTPVNFNWGGLFDGATPGATYGYASIVPKTAGAFYTGIQSTAGTWAGPFALVLQDNSVVTDYVAKQFMEISVNLTKLGIDPGTYSTNPCGTPFRRVLVKTRASTSFTAELKDFIAPYSMFNYPPVDAFTNIVYYCGTFPPTTINVINPLISSIYTWSTTNGHIVGSNVGTSIVVDAPGTYIVTQQLHAQCLLYAQDSVIMLFDSTCAVLDIDLLKFNATYNINQVELSWQISNNREAANFEIEYSFNNRDFTRLGVLNAGQENNLANYSFSNPFSLNNNPVVFFRLKINGRNGKVKYSNIITLRNKGIQNNDVTVFPNPSAGETWLLFNTLQSGVTDISIWDTQGKLICSSRTSIYAGENIVKLPNLTGKPTGVYFVKMKLGNALVTKKIFLIK
jgi:Secretion system C-terminal sorting domain